METYGVNETNPISDEMKEFMDAADHSPSAWIDWDHPQLDKIIRLRLLSDPGFPVWDVSYCYGRMKDGTPVRVALPFAQLPKRNIAGTILEHAKRDKVFAKGLGIFDAISTLC